MKDIYGLEVGRLETGVKKAEIPNAGIKDSNIY